MHAQYCYYQICVEDFEGLLRLVATAVEGSLKHVIKQVSSFWRFLYDFVATLRRIWTTL